MSSLQHYKTNIPATNERSMKQLQVKQPEVFSLVVTISNSARLSVKEMNLTIADVFTKPTIRKVFKGDEFGTIAFSTMQVLLQRLLTSFKFTQKLEPVEIDVLTVTALEKFEYETLEDAVLFFKMARNGTFGAAKKMIDSNLLFGEWFPKYLALKAEEREILKNKQKGDQVDYSEEVMQTYMNKAKRAENERQRKAKIDEINEIVKDFDRQMLEDLIRDLSKIPQEYESVKLLKQKRKEIPWVAKTSEAYKRWKSKEDKLKAEAFENFKKLHDKLNNN